MKRKLQKFEKLKESHLFNVFLAFFVTILWSSSWLIIKKGLEEENVPPILFAGLRYVIASVILLTVAFFSAKNRTTIRNISLRWWLKLVLYGLIFVSVTQGAQFLGLDYLEAITVSLILSFTPILVLFLAFIIIKEKPTLLQIILVVLALVGAIIYFIPAIQIKPSSTFIIGLIIVIIGLLANAFSSVFGRSINQSKELNPLVITSISMFVGAVVLLVVGILREGFPLLSWLAIGYILWLSVVNTAFAFTMWNFVMKKLRAVEVSIVNNTMLFQITFLAVIFLGERPKIIQWVGLIITAFAGLLLPLFRTEPKLTHVEEKITET